jgi:hypothetical protein
MTAVTMRRPPRWFCRMAGRCAYARSPTEHVRDRHVEYHRRASALRGVRTPGHAGQERVERSARLSPQLSCQADGSRRPEARPWIAVDFGTSPRTSRRIRHPLLDGRSHYHPVDHVGSHLPITHADSPRDDELSQLMARQHRWSRSDINRPSEWQALATAR